MKFCVKLLLSLLEMNREMQTHLQILEDNKEEQENNEVVIEDETE